MRHITPFRQMDAMNWCSTPSTTVDVNDDAVDELGDEFVNPARPLVFLEACGRVDLPGQREALAKFGPLHGRGRVRDLLVGGSEAEPGQRFPGFREVLRFLRLAHV